MEIHLVSSLTPDDESRLAPKVLAAIGRVLDSLPVSYSVRIETALGDAIHRNHKADRTSDHAEEEEEDGHGPRHAIGNVTA
jgi:hypothetical protein